MSARRWLMVCAALLGLLAWAARPLAGYCAAWRTTTAVRLIHRL